MVTPFAFSSRVRCLCLAAGLLLFPVTGPAAAPGAVYQYGLFEASFTAAAGYDDPLRDVDVTVEFTAPDGSREQLPAFWDGGRRWVVRFSPNHQGRYTYRSVSRPADAGLEQSGVFIARRYWGRNELYRSGGPRLSDNRRFLTLDDGHPWLWLGDTAWNGALLSTREEWRRYLRDRAARGFSAVQFATTQWRAGRADENGQVAFTGTERIAIHPDFFRRLDEKFEAVNDAGLVAAPVVLWALTSKENESPGISLATGQAILLARYIVARYDAFHVVWILGGDGDYRGANAERWKAIGRAVFDARPHRPVTLHPRGMQDPWAEYKDETWLDVLFFQSGHGNDPKKWRWNATAGGAEAWQLQPARPVIDSEINYEGHLDYQTHERIGEAQVRRAAYYSLLAAPPAGITYGAHGLWFWARKPEVPLDHPRTGVADPWYECLNYPGAKQMGILHRIFDSMAWWKLRPDRTLLPDDADAADFSDHVMTALAEDRSFALLYLPKQRAVKLNLEPLRSHVYATWIDPRTGRRENAQDWKGAVKEAAPPGAGDWLLLLRAAPTAK